MKWVFPLQMWESREVSVARYECCSAGDGQCNLRNFQDVSICDWLPREQRGSIRAAFSLGQNMFADLLCGKDFAWGRMVAESGRDEGQPMHVFRNM
jgi:hypothetical protein